MAVVGSQGALRAARVLLGILPADFPAAVLYAQHRLPIDEDPLARLLRRDCALPVREPEPTEAVRPGVVYVLPADGQSALDPDGRLILDAEARRCRGDTVMASVARRHGSRAIGCVLSGRLDDGAAGLRAIKRAGGRCLVQDPDSAECTGMPLAALATGAYDYTLTPARLGRALVALVTVPGAADLLEVRPHPLAA